MASKKYIFIGNRGYVLEEMQKLHLDLAAIAAIKGSWLEKQLTAKGIVFTSIASKGELLELINNTEFDILLSNGCPFILPVSKLKKPEQLFVNIHPSPLPDLRGMDPVPGALLFGRDSGATCHMMDDGIDTGAIIAKKVIPYSADLDAPLLYQLSFLAEKEVFFTAYERQFQPTVLQQHTGNEIYYTKKDSDRQIDFNAPAEKILRQIKAFSNRSQGVIITNGEKMIKCYDGMMIRNSFLMEKISDFALNEIVLSYENTIIVRKENCFLQLKQLEGDLSEMREGLILK